MVQFAVHLRCTEEVCDALRARARIHQKVDDDGKQLDRGEQDVVEKDGGEDDASRQGTAIQVRV